MTTCTWARPPVARPAALAGAAIVTLLVACSGGNGEGSPLPTVIPGISPVVIPSPGIACDGDLAREPADLTVYGAGAGDFLGDRFSLAAADFNGDGKEDLLIGAPLADGPGNGRENAGEAYIIFGSSSPPAELDLSVEAADVTVYGAEAGDNLGFTVAVGDINGDGLADALVGARFASDGARAAIGKAYVILGRNDLPGQVDTAAGEQDITIIGMETGDFLSIALAAGDMNGDGRDDVLLGAASADGPDNDRPNTDEVYVVLGSEDLGPEVDLAQTPPHLIVFGAAAGDAVPNHLAAGDADGDGRDELIVGAPFADGGEDREDSGRVYVIPVPEKEGSLDLASSDGFTQITGAARKDALGFQVAAGDLNGDGREEIIAGARDADGRGDGANNSGEVHVLLGRDDLPDRVDLAEETLDAAVYGVNPGDSLGFSVAAGDLNGDGLSDLIAGAPIGDGCGNAAEDAGEAYVVLGRPEFPPETALVESTFDRSFFGANAGDELAFSLATGDFDGDGLDDILLGALLADGPDGEREDAGQIHVILSKKR